MDRRRELAKKTVNLPIPCEGIEKFALPEKEERLELGLQGAKKSAKIYKSVQELQLDEEGRALIAQRAASTDGLLTTEHCQAYGLKDPTYRYFAARSAMIQNRTDVFPRLHLWQLRPGDYEALRKLMDPPKKYKDPSVVLLI